MFPVRINSPYIFRIQKIRILIYQSFADLIPLRIFFQELLYGLKMMQMIACHLRFRYDLRQLSPMIVEIMDDLRKQHSKLILDLCSSGLRNSCKVH